MNASWLARLLVLTGDALVLIDGYLPAALVPAPSRVIFPVLRDVRCPVMAAAVAALMMSATITICRKVFGWIAKDEYTGRPTYYVGTWDLLPDLHYTDGETHNQDDE